MNQRLFSLLCFVLAFHTAHGAQPVERVCNSEGCHLAFLVSYEEALCARVVVPTEKDGRLAEVWMSRIEAELASRLNNEPCSQAAFFPVPSRIADYLTPALKALYSALRHKPELLNHDKIESQTFQCLLKSRKARVSSGDTFDEDDGSITITLVIEGCEYQHRRVDATLHTTNKVTMSGFNRPGGIELAYNVPIIR